jgi:hypothetical protein
MTFRKHVFCVLALALSVTMPLSAKVVADATRPINFAWSGGTILLFLTTGGATSISFSGKGKHVVHYSARCAAGSNWYVSIQILIDGVALPPTAGLDDIFCSDFDNDGSADGHVTAHYTVATGALAAGVHTVQVMATAVGGGVGSLSYSSLVVMK